jgi:hypothetical protein
MDRLENEDIGIIWARHYPKRAERASSMSLCLTLAIIIRLRARSMTQYSDWPNKLQHVLADARIPKEEFTAIEVDQPTGIGSD